MALPLLCLLFLLIILVLLLSPLPPPPQVTSMLIVFPFSLLRWNFNAFLSTRSLSNSANAQPRDFLVSLCVSKRSSLIGTPLFLKWLRMSSWVEAGDRLPRKRMYLRFNLPIKGSVFSPCDCFKWTSELVLVRVISLTCPVSSRASSHELSSDDGCTAVVEVTGHSLTLSVSGLADVVLDPSTQDLNPRLEVDAWAGMVSGFWVGFNAEVVILSLLLLCCSFHHLKTTYGNELQRVCLAQTPNFWVRCETTLESG